MLLFSFIAKLCKKITQSKHVVFGLGYTWREDRYPILTPKFISVLGGLECLYAAKTKETIMLTTAKITAHIDVRLLLLV